MELVYGADVRPAPGGGIVVRLDTVAAGTIIEALMQTRDLLTEGDPVADAEQRPLDPFEAIVAPLSHPVSRPDDPVLRQLLPDGVQEDAAAAAEFRAATEHALRERKSSAMSDVIDDLHRLREADGVLHVPAPRVRPWLVGLANVRVALGSMLDVQQDDDLDVELDDYLDDLGEGLDLSDAGEDEGTQRAYRILVYLILTGLQERVVAAALPPRGGRGPG